MFSRLSPVVLGFGQAVVLCAVAMGQGATSHSSNHTNQPFTGIQTSLALAADTALNSTQMEKPPADPDNKTPKGIEIRNLEPKHIPQRPLGRFDVLLSLIEPILIREGIPENLAAVILVESAGNPLALSPKGARGLWQFMPETARRYGLRVDSEIDERVNVQKSTRAAAQYLHDLQMQFGSWPMALAAYNAGEQRLQRAIDRAGSNDFAKLSLLRYIPDETRNYVPAVLNEMGMQSSIAQQNTVVRKPTTFVYALSTVDTSGNPMF